MRAWKCLSCDRTNPSDYEFCGSCAAEKLVLEEEKEEVSVPVTWTCPSCTVMNPNDLIACSVCEYSPIDPTVVFSSEISAAAVQSQRVSSQGESSVMIPNLEARMLEESKIRDPGSALIDFEWIQALREKLEVDGFPVTEASPLPMELTTERLREVRRNRDIVGTLCESAFQASLKYPGQDPLLIPIFAGLGYHCIPQIGVYGVDFTPWDHCILLELTSSLIPPDVVQAVRSLPQWENAEFYLAACNHIASPKVNVMYHTWAFPHAILAYQVTVEDSIDLGGFIPYDSSPVEKGDPLPIGRLESKRIVIHDGAFSPDAAQILLRAGVDSVCSFFSVGVYGTRMAVTLHFIPGNEETRRELVEIAQGSQHLLELLQSLKRSPRMKMMEYQLSRLFPLASSTQQ
jgi:hypothetical protein